MAEDAPTPRQAREQAEHRWPVAIALLVGLALYATVPSDVDTVLRWVVAGVILVAFVPLVLFNPRRLVRENRASRIASAAIGLLLLTANTIALGRLMVALVTDTTDGPLLLLGVLQVWITQVIAFALIYWEIDRGGPVARRLLSRSELPPADFRFPQDEDHDTVDEVSARSSKSADWRPGFLDYLYFSATNSMAFSPTDVMPLSHRAKALMLAESFIAYVVLAIVIARAVSLLG